MQFSKCIYRASHTFIDAMSLKMSLTDILDILTHCHIESVRHFMTNKKRNLLQNQVQLLLTCCCVSL